jgi:hypothetical protein
MIGKRRRLAYKKDLRKQIWYFSDGFKRMRYNLDIIYYDIFEFNDIFGN